MAGRLCLSLAVLEVDFLGFLERSRLTMCNLRLWSFLTASLVLQLTQLPSLLDWVRMILIETMFRAFLVLTYPYQESILVLRYFTHKLQQEETFAEKFNTNRVVSLNVINLK